MEPTALLAVLLGLAVGVGLGWFAARTRTSTEVARASAEARAAQERAAALEAGLAQRLAEADRAAAERVGSLEASWSQRLADERASAERRVSEVRTQFEQRLGDERAAGDRREAAARSQLEKQLAEERAAAAARLEELRNDSQRLAEQFDSLSRQALAANSAAFLEQAEERLKRTQSEGAAELAKREQAVAQLVEPLSRVLGEVKAEVGAAEKARLSAHGALAEQVRAMQESSERLRDETNLLVTALRAPQIRGRWGELQLRRVVEAAGMVEHVDFEEQAHLTTDDGVLRPDLVVRLPGDKQVVVDSKVAFSAYLEAMEARDEATRAKRLEAHARHLRTHIDSLGSKAYWEHVTGTPEFVVMFVPAEVFLNAALEQDPTILEHAFSRNVVVATPATLVALLRTVGYTWRQEMLAAEAMQVLTVGRELHKRLSVLGGHLQTLGRRLNSAVEAYNTLNSSLDRNVVTQVRRFSALQGLEPALEAAPPLEVLAVAAHKEDLYAEPQSDAIGADDVGADPVVSDLVRTELGRSAAASKAAARVSLAANRSAG